MATLKRILRNVSGFDLSKRLQTTRSRAHEPTAFFAICYADMRSTSGVLDMTADAEPDARATLPRPFAADD
jgi:hypothetical protein